MMNWLANKIVNHANEAKSTKKERDQFRDMLHRLVSQYRAFGVISPSFLQDAEQYLGPMPDSLRELFTKNGIQVDPVVDTVPRTDYEDLRNSLERYRKMVGELQMQVSSLLDKKIESISNTKNETGETLA